MEAAIVLLGIFLAMIWFIHGLINNRMDERDEVKDEQLQEYYDSLSDNRKADYELHDPDHVKRVQDYFNSN